MDILTSKDGTTIAFERFGAGPPLVYVTGAICDRSSGVPLARLLAPRYTVYTYDRRGRGDSGDTGPYAVEREIEDLAAVIEAAGGSATVVGHSSGAALAVEAAAAGLPITELVAFEPPYAESEDEQRQGRQYVADLTEVLAAGRRDAALELFMTLVGMPPEAIAGTRQTPWWPVAEALAPSLAYDAAVMGFADTGGVLPADRARTITVPTLALAGGASPALLQRGAERIAEVVPGGRYRVLPGQTHAVAPDAFADAVRTYLGEHR